MTHRRRSWLLLLAPALLATALPLRAEPIPIPTSSPFPIEGLMTRMLNQADVPPIPVRCSTPCAAGWSGEASPPMR
ncbi:MAG: hypothetical protein ACODUE_07400 [Synechococcus sp.]